MIKVLKIISTCLLLQLSGCSPVYKNFYEKKDRLDVNELITNDEGIIIFETIRGGLVNAMSGSFVNLDKSETIKRIRSVSYASGLNVVKVKSGRYVYALGVFEEASIRDSSSQTMYLFMPPLMYLFFPPTFYPVTENKQRAVFHFTVKPGDILYVGSMKLDSMLFPIIKGVILYDDLEKIKEKLKGDYPEMLKYITKDINSSLAPISCITYLNNSASDSVIKDNNLKECNKALLDLFEKRKEDKAVA